MAGHCIDPLVQRGVKFCNYALLPLLVSLSQRRLGFVDGVLRRQISALTVVTAGDLLTTVRVAKASSLNSRMKQLAKASFDGLPSGC